MPLLIVLEKRVEHFELALKRGADGAPELESGANVAGHADFGIFPTGALVHGFQRVLHSPQLRTHFAVLTPSVVMHARELLLHKEDSAR